MTSGKVTFKNEQKISIVKFDCEIVQTEKEALKGLSGIKRIRDNFGLLYILDLECIENVWMKDVLTSLDIIFINKSKQIVKLYMNTETDNETILSSIYPAKYIFETKCGLAEKFGIKEGQYFDWEKL